MKLINFTLIFFLLFNSFLNSNEIVIKYKVHNNIITNIDIENEKKYLILINPNLKQLSNKELNNLSSNSLIREFIKSEKIEEFFDISKDFDFVNEVEKNFYSKLGIKNITEYKNLIKQSELDYNEIRNKLKIETLWNKLIYDKFNKSIKIDKKFLKDKILKAKENSKKKYEYKLFEILIEKNNNSDLSKKLQEINKSIKDIGFRNTSNIYSISASSKFGGEIGWLKETQLSNNIINELRKLKKNEISKPISLASGILLLKYSEKKEIITEFNLDKELEALIEFETNRQLNQFSLIYYKRLKQNTNINEVK